MFRANSPLTILNAQAEALAAHLPAVFAGPAEAHRSRAWAGAQVTLFVTVAEAECRDLHGRFLARRQRLLELCACAAANRPSPRRGLAPLTIAAVAAVAGLEAIRRHRGARRSPDRRRALEHESEVAARIPMGAFGGVRTE